MSAEHTQRKRSTGEGEAVAEHNPVCAGWGFVSTGDLAEQLPKPCGNNLRAQGSVRRQNR